MFRPGRDEVTADLSYVLCVEARRIEQAIPSLGFGQVIDSTQIWTCSRLLLRLAALEQQLPSGETTLFSEFTIALCSTQM